MRDLDQLQEQDPDQRRRGIATLLVLATVLLGLFGAVFSHWSRATGRDPHDLDAFGRLVRLQPTAAAQDHALADARSHDGHGDQDDDEASTRHSGSALDASKLTFESALTGHEDRPELVAALEAEDRLQRRLTETSVMAATRAPSREPRVDPVPLVSIPAGMSASSAGQQLERAARHDKLVAAAMQYSGKGHMRTSGSADGGFLLHVISYDSRPPAETLANALRDKGYDAFVEAGDVNGRGRYFRVRIGPFPSKPAADVYRREFEATERMNTIVVRRDE
jgi:DedD protein